MNIHRLWIFISWWRHHPNNFLITIDGYAAYYIVSAIHMKMGHPRMKSLNLCSLDAVTWLLTHWGRVTHICVSKSTIIDLDNGLSPGQRQAIIWTNDGMLLIGPLRTNFSEIQIEILIFSFKKMSLKASSAKWRPFCLGLNVLKIRAPGG